MKFDIEAFKPSMNIVWVGYVTMTRYNGKIREVINRDSPILFVTGIDNCYYRVDTDAVVEISIDPYLKMNSSEYYQAKDGKIYDKMCYNCRVKWLGELRENSLEQDRCDSCIVDNIHTKWEIDQQRLDNNRLNTIHERIYNY